MIYDLDWSNLQKEIDDTVISEIETELYVKFPKSYIDFIKVYHGASPTPNIIKFHGETETIKSFLSMDRDNENFIIQVYKENRELLPDDVIPIALTDCIDLICFDYRKGRSIEPSVVYWNFEFAIENYNKSVYPICKNLEMLFDLFYKY